LRKRRLLALSIPIAVVAAYAVSASAGLGPGVGNLPQGTQTNQAYAKSFWTNGVTNVFATTQQTSCYTPEVQYGANAGPNDGYSGETACGTAATTGEAQGPYAQQASSNPGYGVGPPDLVKNHSESDIRVDPTNPNHVIGSVKWIVSAEGYNHLLGFYESWDGGKTWPVQGHIPGYEGWTDNTDPVGAFDGFGNYYELNLPYQFFYNSDGSHNYATNPNKEPNPGVPAEAISIAVHPAHAIAGVPLSQSWITTHNNAPDYVAPYPKKGQEPDKQWITIDTNTTSPNYNTIYAMWAVFDGINSKPFVSTAKALPDGTHTDWSAPVLLPTVNNTASDTYLLPHVAPDGTVYTSITNFPAKHGYCCITVSADKSADGGKTWTFLSTAVSNIPVPSFVGGYANTTFTDGIDNTFAVGLTKVNGNYPLYIAYNEESAGVSNVKLTASFDGGKTWTSPIQVNDNKSAVDEFQPNLAAAANGTVSVNFYDRRLACPLATETAEAGGAGIALDTSNPNYSGSLPPYGATNYCVNTSIQFYKADLSLISGHEHNIRLSQHTWDPQLNSPIRFCVCQPNATFIGDYFGNVAAGSIDYTTSVSTFNDTSLPTNQQNPSYYQQQVVATVAIP
jgi:hypothetical protein